MFLSHWIWESSMWINSFLCSVSIWLVIVFAYFCDKDYITYYTIEIISIIYWRNRNNFNKVWQLAVIYNIWTALL